MDNDHASLRELYCLSPAELGFAFSYPRLYVASIAWAQRDFDAGGDGHALTFLRRQDVTHEMSIVRRAGARQALPFARSANNDVVYCFDATDPLTILSMDLGHPRRQFRVAGTQGYLMFLNAYRHNEGLQPWTPTCGLDSGQKDAC